MTGAGWGLLFVVLAALVVTLTELWRMRRGLQALRRVEAADRAPRPQDDDLRGPFDTADTTSTTPR